MFHPSRHHRPAATRTASALSSKLRYATYCVLLLPVHTTRTLSRPLRSACKGAYRARSASARLLGGKGAAQQAHTMPLLYHRNLVRRSWHRLLGEGGGIKPPPSHSSAVVPARYARHSEVCAPGGIKPPFMRNATRHKWRGQFAARPPPPSSVSAVRALPPDPLGRGSIRWPGGGSRRCGGNVSAQAPTLFKIPPGVPSLAGAPVFGSFPPPPAPPSGGGARGLRPLCALRAHKGRRTGLTASTDTHTGKAILAPQSTRRGVDRGALWMTSRYRYLCPATGQGSH